MISPLLYGVVSIATMLLLLASYLALKKKDSNSEGPQNQQPILFIQPLKPATEPLLGEKRISTRPKDYGIQSLAREIAATSKSRDSAKSGIPNSVPARRFQHIPKIHREFSDSTAIPPRASYRAEAQAVSSRAPAPKVSPEVSAAPPPVQESKPEIPPTIPEFSVAMGLPPQGQDVVPEFEMPTPVPPEPASAEPSQPATAPSAQPAKEPEVFAEAAAAPELAKLLDNPIEADALQIPFTYQFAVQVPETAKIFWRPESAQEQPSGELRQELPLDELFYEKSQDELPREEPLKEELRSEIPVEALPNDTSPDQNASATEVSQDATSQSEMLPNAISQSEEPSAAGLLGGELPPVPIEATEDIAHAALAGRVLLDHLSFYGLNQEPFDVTPDPGYLYLSRTHRDALNALTQGIQNFRGFMALVADPGLGKTTVLHKIMEECRNTARVVFLFQTQCTSSELLRFILSELGVNYSGSDIVEMHKRLNEALFQEMLLERRFVLIVDEAQNLDDAVLETIRLLSNFETSHSKLIQIVLAGQPELMDTLVRPRMSQLRQRISILKHLESLNASETVEYIQHRLCAAGFHGRPMFTTEALTAIFERSGGVPRCINNICFNAMRLGYARHKNTIDAEVVTRVAEELDMELLIKRTQKPAVPAQLALEETNGNAAAANKGNASRASEESATSSQLARILLNVLTHNPANAAALAQPKKSFALTGKLTEKLTSQSWGKKNEFRIQVSLEREYSPTLPVADHYYCRSFYVSEEQAVRLHEGKQIRIKFEQD